MGTPLQFIGTNPASEAWRRGQQANQEQESHDLAMARGDVEMVAAPTRLRMLGSQAREAGANADVAGRTVGSRIERSDSLARGATADADVAQQTVAPRIARANTEADQSAFSLDRSRQLLPNEVATGAANARRGAAEADYAQQSLPGRVREVNARANTLENQEELNSFTKSMEALSKGNIDEARQWAQRGGSDIPPAILNNAVRLKAFTDHYKVAKDMYPNSPQRQMEYVKYAMQGLADGERDSQGVLQPKPEDGINNPDIPKPDAVALTKTTGSQPANIQTATWLAERIAKTQNRDVTDADYLAAYREVNTAKTNPAARAGLIQKIYNTMVNDFSDDRESTEKLQAATSMVDEMMAASGTGPAGTPAPAQPAPGAAASPKAPDGKTYPTVSDQAGYNALPPGSVYWHATKQQFLTKGQ